MTILFWTLVAMFCIAVGIWFYTIFNKKARKNRTYLYSTIVLDILALITAIIALMVE